MNIIPVILSGGSGTRLWPLSRKQHPKQYLPLISNNTMLQETILRLDGIENLADPIIVCNESHRFLVADQCQQIGMTNLTILLEPVGRNTAPAIASAAIQSLKDLDDAVLLIFSADHVIKDIHALHNAINIAGIQAQDGKLAIFGIVPTDANTGYGYIKSFADNSDGSGKVEEFIEKPDLETAKNYLEQGDYLWNSGMFMFKATTLINELESYAPDIVKAVRSAVDNASHDLDFVRLEKQAFMSSPSNSIDYALLEKSNNVVVVPLDAGWSDIGSWSSLYDFERKDINGNVFQGDTLIKETTNTYISASDNHMIVTIGIDNMVIINTPDVTLVASKESSSMLSLVVEELSNKNDSRIDNNRKVHRPWGWYDSLDFGKNFHVKRIHVNPGGKLSLQSHEKRAEHWIVIKGTAHTIVAGSAQVLNENQSIYVPMKHKHLLENRDKKNYLELIEVQSGTYFGEDDIVRYDDIYGRDI